MSVGTGNNRLEPAEDEATQEQEPELRNVRPSEIASLVGFQDRTWRDLPDKRFVCRRERPYYERLLGGAGTVIGAFTDAGMVGFSACEFHPPAEKVARLCPFVPPAEREAVAIHGGTLIDQRHRNHGLGRRLHTERLRSMRERGCLHSVGVTFFLNHRSLALAFWLGRLIKGTVVDQDGPNFVTHLDLRAISGRRSSPGRAVEFADFDAHLAAIADGLWGYGLQSAERGLSLLYASFDDDQIEASSRSITPRPAASAAALPSSSECSRAGLHEPLSDKPDDAD